MRWAFDQIEKELVATIVRLAGEDGSAAVEITSFRHGDEQYESFSFSRAEVSSFGRLKHEALERAKDFASELSLAMIAAAPLGVRWIARVFFDRRSFSDFESGTLAVFWTIEPG